MIPCIFPRRNDGVAGATVLAVVAALTQQASAGGGGGGAIFSLKYSYLDNWVFWAILAGMVFYGLFIDRFQYFALKAVEHNRCNKMIADRVITEFMVFGIVALTLFILGTVKTDLDPLYLTQLKFCDLLVSFAACFLIILGGFYSWMRYRIEKYLSGFADEDGNSSQVIDPLFGWCPMAADMQRIFIERNNLDLNTFSWNLYFQEALAHQICELMNISWMSWGITFVCALPVIFFKHSNGKARLPAYLAGFAIATWTMVILTLITLIKLRQLRTKLYDILEQYIEGGGRRGFTITSSRSLRRRRTGEAEEDNDHEESVVEQEQDLKFWNAFLQMALQVEAMVTCFFLGMYIMHLQWNLAHTEEQDVRLATWVWHVVFLSAFVLSLLILGPLAILELTSIQAFTMPDKDVLSSIVSLIGEAHRDIEHIRWQMEGKAHLEGFNEPAGENSPQAWAERKLCETHGDSVISRLKMHKALASLGIYIHRVRAEHVFDLVYVVRARKNSEVTKGMFGMLDQHLSVGAFVDTVFASHLERSNAVQGW